MAVPSFIGGRFCLMWPFFQPLTFLCIIMQIVPTEYRYISKEVLPTNQFSVTEYFSPMNEFDRSWPGWLTT